MLGLLQQVTPAVVDHHSWAPSRWCPVAGRLVCASPRWGIEWGRVERLNGMVWILQWCADGLGSAVYRRLNILSCRLRKTERACPTAHRRKRRALSLTPVYGCSFPCPEWTVASVNDWRIDGQMIFTLRRGSQVVQPLPSDGVSHADQASCGKDGLVNHGKAV